ncbi:sugE protein [Listeria monocytogenes]|nr:sugE protein [Listeria monocytogenes]
MEIENKPKLTIKNAIVKRLHPNIVKPCDSFSPKAQTISDNPAIIK